MLSVKQSIEWERKQMNKTQSEEQKKRRRRKVGKPIKAYRVGLIIYTLVITKLSLKKSHLN